MALVPGPGWCKPCPESKPCPPTQITPVVLIQTKPQAMPALERSPLSKVLDAAKTLQNFTNLSPVEPVFDPKPAELRRAADVQGLSAGEANRALAQYIATKQTLIDTISEPQALPVTNSNLMAQELAAFAPSLERCACPPDQIRIQTKLGECNKSCWAGLAMLAAIPLVAYAIRRIT